MAFLSESQLQGLGLASVGDNVLISDKVSFYNTSNIKIGSNVRIDDFAILSAGEGGIEMGNYIHIACYSSLIGKGKIVLGDFANISSRVSIYSSNDDYSGTTMTNPMIPNVYKQVIHGDVIIERHVIVGSGSVILPNVVLYEGVAIGALSLVKDSCNSWKIYTGNPARYLKDRSRKLLQFEAKLISNSHIE